MDAGLLRGIFTLFMFLAFCAIVVWAWSSRRKTDFDAAANLPLLDDSLLAADADESGKHHKEAGQP